MPLQNALLLGLAAMFLHEVGHVAAALALKVKVHQVGINRKGAYLRREAGTARQNLAITLSGPGINLALAFLFHDINPHFALCNLVIGITNLLPIPASDGSRALALVRRSIALVHVGSH